MTTATQEIAELFPELCEIADDDLRARVAAVWNEAITTGCGGRGWTFDELRAVKFTLLAGDIDLTFVDHVRSCVRQCLAIANVLGEIFGDKIRYEHDPYEAAEGCDAVILCTEWYEFRAVDFGSSSDPPPVSSTESGGFRMLVDAIHHVFPDATIAPWIITYATDSRYFTPIADDVYRFAPFRLEGGDLDRVHGTGERFAVADAEGVVEFYRTLITRAGSSG